MFEKKDDVFHTWGATKILKSLSEDYLRTKDPVSKDLARKVMLRLKGLAQWGQGGKAAWFPGGMAAVKPDGTLLSTGWSINPAPIVEPLLTYHLATGDVEGLVFARAYAEGIMGNMQPGGVRFTHDGRFDDPLGHSHAIMHSLWGISHLGILEKDSRYMEFCRRAWDWMLSRGTGTGWFPAMPDNCNETCCVSDMISNACLIGRDGHPQYFDYAERYLRNYIANLQFVLTPEFEVYYRRLNAAAGAEAVEKGLAELSKFQGGIIGGSGLNDVENELLGRVSGFEMFGCCAPEGMRAIHTAWASTIEHREKSPWGPAGVYVNLGLSRESPWGEVVSFFPVEGRLTVKASTKDAFHLRPPHWAPRAQVAAYIGTKAVPVTWTGDYVHFDAAPGDELTITYPIIGFTHTVSGLWKDTRPDLTMEFEWLGNMVTRSTPGPEKTPLFAPWPRRLPRRRFFPTETPMTSRERVQAALAREEPDSVPIDLGGSVVTSIGLPGIPRPSRGPRHGVHAGRRLRVQPRAQHPAGGPRAESDRRRRGCAGRRRIQRGARMSLLGVDIGSSSVKAAVFSHGGTTLVSVSKSYPTVSPGPSMTEVDPEEIWLATAGAIREAAAGAGADRVEALCIGAHGETFISLDRAGRPVGRAIMNSDNRATDEAARLERELGRERLYGLSGAMAHPMYPLPKLRWLAAHAPAVTASAVRHLGPGEFVLQRMGLPALTDYSLACRWMLFDVRARRWSPDLLEAARAQGSGAPRGRAGRYPGRASLRGSRALSRAGCRDTRGRGGA